MVSASTRSSPRASGSRWGAGPASERRSSTSSRRLDDVHTSASLSGSHLGVGLASVGAHFPKLTFRSLVVTVLEKSAKARALASEEKGGTWVTGEWNAS